MLFHHSPSPPVKSDQKVRSPSGTLTASGLFTVPSSFLSTLAPPAPDAVPSAEAATSEAFAGSEVFAPSPALPPQPARAPEINDAANRTLHHLFFMLSSFFHYLRLFLSKNLEEANKFRKFILLFLGNLMVLIRYFNSIVV